MAQIIHVLYCFSEGFVVDGKPGKTLQEVAEDYFSELIERSMIQAVDVDCFGEVHACRIHDIIFELIAMKSFEENFVTIIGNHRSTPTQRPYVRRLSLSDDLDWSNLNMPHARSLTVNGSIDNLDSVPLCRFLRLLDFQCCRGVNSRHLKDIGELFPLKYLSFKSTWISELPVQIGRTKISGDPGLDGNKRARATGGSYSATEDGKFACWSSRATSRYWKHEGLYNYYYALRLLLRGLLNGLRKLWRSYFG
jgi:disease resistance protein RPM1